MSAVEYAWPEPDSLPEVEQVSRRHERHDLRCGWTDCHHAKRWDYKVGPCCCCKSRYNRMHRGYFTQELEGACDMHEFSVLLPKVHSPDEAMKFGWQDLRVVRFVEDGVILHWSGEP
jgi:hypothetical protein